jgi:hypothetical protein
MSGVEENWKSLTAFPRSTPWSLYCLLMAGELEELVTLSGAKAHSPEPVGATIVLCPGMEGRDRSGLLTFYD